MADYGSDEEQLDALKRWWQENGNALLTGIVVVLAVFFGVRQFESWQTSKSNQASDLYQQISDLALARMTEPVSAEELTSAQGVYATLRGEFPDSIYTRYAALAMARFQTENGQLDLAAAELQWMLDNPKLGLMQEADEELYLTARLRLARIKLAQGEPQSALDLLNAVEPGGMQSGYSEVEGDALVALGQNDAARDAYSRALETSEAGNPVLLQLKLQDLGVSPVDPQ